MENLPYPAVLNIAAYLQPRDLMACSAVCKKWREKLNIDVIWSPHLQFAEKFYKLQEKYKDMILCQPYLELLPPLCPARENYIRDQCLRFNCRAGLFTSESFKPKTSDKFGLMTDFLDQEGNYWLFLSTYKTIEVWNITNKPYFHTCTQKRLPNIMDQIYVFERKVVLVVLDFVQVFSFEHPKYELLLMCCFFIEQESPLVEIQGQLDPRHCQPATKHIVSGNILIGYPGMIMKSCLPTAFMHIWNLDTLVKLSTRNAVHEPILRHIFDPEHENSNTIRFEFYKGDPKSVIVVLHDDSEEKVSVITIFSTEYLKYYPFMKFSSKATIICCSIASKKVVIFGWDMIRSSFFVRLLDISGRDIVMKLLTRFGVDQHSQIVFHSPLLYLKTSEQVILIDVRGDKLVISTLIEDGNLSHEQIYVVSPFIFSKNHRGLEIRMWDMDLKCQIRDLYGNIDISRAISLKEVHFPPKISFPDFEHNTIQIFSFW